MGKNDSQNLSLYWVGKVQCPPAHVDDSIHQHDFHELIFLVSGNYQVEVDGVTHQLKKGDYIIYPPGLKHRPIYRPDFTYFYVLQWNENANAEGELLLGTDTTLRISVLAHWIWSCFPSDDSATVALQHSLLKTILQYCNMKPRDYRGPVEEVEHYLNNITHAEVSMEELAATVNLSTRHLSRLFIEKHGVTPKQYLNQLRLEKARNLLISTQFDFNEIADMVGFGTSNNLYRKFKKEYGLSPSAYRDKQTPK